MSQRAMLGQALGAEPEQVRVLIKEWANGLASRMAIEIRTQGVDRVDWSRPVVIMANHQSYLDVLALFSALPRPVGVLAKKELFAVPLFGGVMRAIGCVPVDRSNRGEAMEMVRGAADQVRAGSSIAVFPEGTRGPGDRVAPMKKGPFYLAQLADVDIVPVGIRGSGKLMPRSNTAIYPGVIEVSIGDPLRFPAGGGPAARRVAMTMVRDALCHLTGLPALGDGRRSVPPRPIDDAGAGAGASAEREAPGGATPARGRS
jgi:1-acyl-sn-glycerol-3-phosphate acyltransferase